MNKIQPPDEKIGNSNKKEIVGANKLSRVPSDHEYAKGNNDREEFGNTMEEKVIIEAADIEPDQCQHPQKKVEIGFFQRLLRDLCLKNGWKILCFARIISGRVNLPLS